jgi:flagellar hook-associated protein 3 FlgL
MSSSLDNIYYNTTFALRLNDTNLARLQEQVTTGSRINRPSDDPSASYRVLGLNSKKRSLEQYINSLSEMISKLDFSSTVVGQINTNITDVKLAITQITGGIYDDNARQRTAEGINDVLEQIVSLANTNHNNQYLYGGTNTSTAPYSVTRSNGNITRVTYQGSYENRDVEVAPGVDASSFQVGADIFHSDERSAPEFANGTTGIANGTGTSNVNGFTWLTVTGTTGNYDISIDGGLTSVNTDGTDTNLAVTNSVTGEVLYVDTTGITTAGVDLVSVPGTHDIFNTLITIREIFANNLGFDANTQLPSMIDKTLVALNEVNDLLLQNTVSVGSKIGFLDNLQKSLENQKFDAEEETTRLEEADIAQIAIDLSRHEVLYQMSLTTAAKLLSMSLLDFI